MNKMFTVLIACAVLSFPAVSSAAPLTESQANSIILVLEAFGVDAQTISNIHDILFPPAPQIATSTTPIQSDPMLGAINTVPAPANAPMVQSEAMEPEIIIHDNTAFEYSVAERRNDPNLKAYGVFIKDVNGLFTEDHNKSITMKVNGVPAQTQTRNMNILWDEKTHKPGNTFFVEVKPGDVISFEAEGMSKTVE